MGLSKSELSVLIWAHSYFRNAISLNFSCFCKGIYFDYNSPNNVLQKKKKTKDREIRVKKEVVELKNKEKRDLQLDKKIFPNNYAIFSLKVCEIMIVHPSYLLFTNLLVFIQGFR